VESWEMGLVARRQTPGVLQALCSGKEKPLASPPDARCGEGARTRRPPRQPEDAGATEAAREHRRLFLRAKNPFPGVPAGDVAPFLCGRLA